MKKLLLTLLLVLSGSACSTTSQTYLKRGDSSHEMARVSREPPRLFDFSHWSGWIGDVVDVRGVSVIDSRPFGHWKRKHFKYVDLSAGIYRVTLDCTNTMNNILSNHVIEYPTSIVLNLEAQKEYILACREVSSEKSGSETKTIRLMLIETKNRDSR